MRSPFDNFCGALFSNETQRREGFQTWLRSRFEKNVPYDEWARDILKAEGTSADGASRSSCARNAARNSARRAGRGRRSLTAPLEKA